MYSGDEFCDDDVTSGVRVQVEITPRGQRIIDTQVYEQARDRGFLDCTCPFDWHRDDCADGSSDV